MVHCSKKPRKRMGPRSGKRVLLCSILVFYKSRVKIAVFVSDVYFSSNAHQRKKRLIDDCIL